MNKLAFISLFAFLIVKGFSQEKICERVQCLTVDDKTEGYVLFSYKIPEDGAYTFSVDGGLAPKNQFTVYYYEYRFRLAAAGKQFIQPHFNISSQAQDGDVCEFGSNEKNNKISGEFTKDDMVEVRLELLKSDVNGEPHHKLQLTTGTKVYVEKHKTLATNN